MSPILALAAVILADLSGVSGIFLARGKAAGQHIATALSLAASGLGRRQSPRNRAREQIYPRGWGMW
jgi:hypothetical protein